MADDKVQQKVDDGLVVSYELLYWATAVGLSQEELKKLLARAIGVEAASVPRPDR
jgi:hypothetical protein